MAGSPGMDDMEMPDETDDGKPPWGHLVIGEHAFALLSPVEGAKNVGAYTSCPPTAVNLERKAMGDHYGDGAAETNSEEIEGLRTLLFDT